MYFGGWIKPCVSISKVLPIVQSWLHDSNPFHTGYLSGPWQGPRIFINSFLPVKPSKKSRTCSRATSRTYARAIDLKIYIHKVKTII